MFSEIYFLFIVNGLRSDQTNVLSPFYQTYLVRHYQISPLPVLSPHSRIDRIENKSTFSAFTLATSQPKRLLRAFAPADEDLIILAKAVGNDRNIAAKPIQTVGEAAAHVQAALSGTAKGRCG